MKSLVPLRCALVNSSADVRKRTPHIRASVVTKQRISLYTLLIVNRLVFSRLNENDLYELLRRKMRINVLFLIKGMFLFLFFHSFIHLE